MPYFQCVKVRLYKQNHRKIQKVHSECLLNLLFTQHLSHTLRRHGEKLRGFSQQVEHLAAVPECGRPVLGLHQHRAAHRADGRPVRGPRHRPGPGPALQSAGRLVCQYFQGPFTNDEKILYLQVSTNLARLLNQGCAAPGL